MKIKAYGTVFGVALVFLVLGNCVFGQQTKADILKLIPQEWKDRDQKAMESLADRIIKDNTELAQFFESGDRTAIEAITARYAEMKGTIVDQGYNVISPKDAESFRRFWGHARVKGPRLEFKTVSIYLTDKLGPQSGVVTEAGRPAEVVKFNYMAFVVHEFAYGPKNGPRGSVNDDQDTRTYCHQETCPWRCMQ